MKKILITGANSYIGGEVESHLISKGYGVTVIDMIGDEWRSVDFSEFDCVFHVAGIVHDFKKSSNKELFYKVNRDLAIETAEKAKASGVKHFILMSSMSVYGAIKDKNITINTVPRAKDYYGDSKLLAELALQKMSSESFAVSIIRPPMIFGSNCKGNFPRITSLIMKTPLFPKIKNKRSMLHIDNLNAIVELIIKNREQGLFFPQNPDYFCITDLAVKIAALKGKKLKTTKIFNWLVFMSKLFLSSPKKLFDNLTYDKSLSNHFNNDYQVVDNDESLHKSVNV